MVTECLSSAMLSTTAEYALRITVFLAEQPDRFYTATDIAARTRVPGGYLLQGHPESCPRRPASSQRGQNGGVKLRATADSITLYDVVHTVTPFQRIC